MLRSLDPVKFDAFWEKWELPKPREGWLSDTRMIMMHKSRLCIEDFSEEEKAVSRRWLEEHHCSMNFWETKNDQDGLQF